MFTDIETCIVEPLLVRFAYPAWLEEHSETPNYLKPSHSHVPADTCHVAGVCGEALLAVVYSCALSSFLNAIPKHSDGALLHLLYLSIQNGHPEYCSTWRM